MSPFFSVIIPTLNEELYLPRLLKDLANQKKKNFEIIVADGRSKDRTPEIIKDYSKLMPIRQVTIKEANLSNQKNLGAQNAKGNYLIFLDADMSISPTFTSIMQKQVLSKKGLVFIPYVVPREKKEFPDVNMIFNLLNKLIALSLNFNKPFSGGASMVWEKQVFYAVGGFDNIFGEDHQIIRKAHLWGIHAKFLYLPKVKFSLRRMKKEGRLRLIYHFVMSHIYLMFNDKFKNEAFTYQMGGQVYNQKNNKSEYLIPQNLVKSTKKFFQTILSEK